MTSARRMGSFGGRALVLLLLLLLAGGPGHARPARAASSACQSRTLLAVAATSASNAWTVGFCADDHQNLIEHWDGRTWTVLPTPALGYQSSLSGVAATSATSVWAVGWYMLADGITTRTLIEHWNGAAWTVQSSPSPYRFKSEPYAELSAVTAVSPRNAWAVGRVGGPYAVIEHWDGKAWRVQRSPRNLCCFNGVVRLSSQDAWAVGDSFFLGGGARIVHWNGRSWALQRIPQNDAELDGVAAVASNTAWAVGPGLMLRWNGRIWTRRSTPRPSRIALQSVAATSSGNAWAVGVERQPPGTQALQVGVIERWDGRRWTIQFTTPGTPVADFASVAATSPVNAWAVGSDRNRALIEHWDGTAWAPQIG
jgi:hypothetical protein